MKTMDVGMVINSFKRHVALTPEEEALILEKLQYKKIKKKDFLFREGDKVPEVAFVLSGCLRSYSTDENGFEHILQFAPFGWWITDLYGMISGQPSSLWIEAVSDTEVALLNRKDQLDLFDKIPKLERYFRILTENALVSSRKRTLDSLTLTARQRYSDFCNSYPSLVNEVPLKLIAAYIGITPEFLSKIRAESPGRSK